MQTAVAVVDTIQLTFRRSAYRTVKVTRDDYLKAKEDGSLPWFLDPYLSDMDDDIIVVEPDGTMYNPYWMPDEKE